MRLGRSVGTKFRAMGVGVLVSPVGLWQFNVSLRMRVSLEPGRGGEWRPAEGLV